MSAAKSFQDRIVPLMGLRCLRRRRMSELLNSHRRRASSAAMSLAGRHVNPASMCGTHVHGERLHRCARFAAAEDTMAQKKSARKQPVRKQSRKSTTRTAAKKGKMSKLVRWSSDDVKQLKTLIKQNTPTRVIGVKVRRTEASVRQHAFRLGLSLRPTNRAPRD